MFQGFPEEFAPFLVTLEANNNKAFFEEHRALYERVLRDPLTKLAEALAPRVLQIDPTIDARPSRAVSRINRDVRFSRDKSPYRTYQWIGFKRAGESRSETCGFYFDMSVSEANFGCGFYHMQPQYMQNLRQKIVNHPGHIEQILSEPRFAELFVLKGERYQRKFTPPEGLSPVLSQLYTHKNIYAEHTLSDLSLLFSPRLADVIAEGFDVLIPFYTLLSDCMEST